MPTFSTPRSASPRSSSKRSAVPKRGVVSPGCSLTEARLHRIWNPTSVEFRAWLTWTSRFRGWTRERVQERRDEIAPMVAALRALVTSPPEWSSEKWLAMEDRLQAWKGQLRAATDFLEKSSTP